MIKGRFVRARESVKRKNKVLRHILCSLKKCTGKISPEVPEKQSRASTSASSIVDELICGTPESIYSGRRIFYVKECDDDNRHFSASSFTSSLLEYEYDFLQSALDRIPFDMEHGDGRLYELLMGVMHDQRDRVLEDLDDVFGYDLVKTLEASPVKVEKEENGVTYDLVECLN